VALPGKAVALPATRARTALTIAGAIESAIRSRDRGGGGSLIHKSAGQKPLIEG
jgi:hypothetical protein